MSSDEQARKAREQSSVMRLGPLPTAEAIAQLKRIAEDQPGMGAGVVARDALVVIDSLEAEVETRQTIHKALRRDYDELAKWNADLRAEVERLTKLADQLDRDLIAEREAARELVAEVERLTKAWDDLHYENVDLKDSLEAIRQALKPLRNDTDPTIPDRGIDP